MGSQELRASHFFSYSKHIDNALRSECLSFKDY